ncbi:MAG: NUDIX hydrolase [Candidatus Paceibacterota bacterium]
MTDIKLQVGVKIFLKNPEGKFLLVKRNSDKYKNVKGEWDIVGGRIDLGSDLLSNLRREVMEETKLQITFEPRLVYAQDIISNEEKHVVRLSYIGDTQGEPELDLEENIEYQWLTLEELTTKEDLDIYVKDILDKGLLENII